MRVDPVSPWRGGPVRGWGSSALEQVAVRAVGWILEHHSYVEVEVAAVPQALGQTFARR